MKVLMTDPSSFEVIDVKNPWMTNNLYKVNTRTAILQWESLKITLERLGVEVQIIDRIPYLEDMVFTANCGLVRKSGFVVSNMVHESRAKESSQYISFFATSGYLVYRLPTKYKFEGQGDALWHPNKRVLFGGYGFRTDIRAYFEIQKIWPDVEIVPLKLVDESLYHLDTCFVPLDENSVMLYEDAFDEQSLKSIKDYFMDIITIGCNDALKFCCNAVMVDKTIVLNKGISDMLRETLQLKGFKVIEIDLSEFLKSGGSAACMVIKI